jgi:transposase
MAQPGWSARERRRHSNRRSQPVYHFLQSDKATSRARNYPTCGGYARWYRSPHRATLYNREWLAARRRIALARAKSLREAPRHGCRRRFLRTQYATAEKGFGIESHLPVVLIVTGRESLSPFQEVTMRGRRSAWTITLDFPTRTTLQHWVQRRKTPVGLARRARAMLLLEQGHSCVQTAKWVGLADYHVRKWAKRFQERGVAGLREKPRPGHPPVFAPEVALHLVKLACERPDHVGISLSQWDCPELARRLKADGVVSTISADTIERILRSHKLKPWRHHLWLSADVPRDQHFAQQISDLVDLYTRPLADEEMVVCADEKTNLQPRPRLAATLPTRGIPTDSPGAWLQASRGVASLCRF